MTVIENLKRSTCNVFIKNIYRRFIIGHLVVHFGIQLAFLLGHHVNNIIAISIGWFSTSNWKTWCYWFCYWRL